MPPVGDSLRLLIPALLQLAGCVLLLVVVFAWSTLVGVAALGAVLLLAGVTLDHGGQSRPGGKGA